YAPSQNERQIVQREIPVDEQDSLLGYAPPLLKPQPVEAAGGDGALLAQADLQLLVVARSNSVDNRVTAHHDRRLRRAAFDFHVRDDVDCAGGRRLSQMSVVRQLMDAHGPLEWLIVQD